MDHNDDFIAGIIDRMKTVIGASSDKELTSFFGRSKSGPASWKKRGKIPFNEVMQLAQQRGTSLDWLVFGRQPPAGGLTIEATAPGDAAVAAVDLQVRPLAAWHEESNEVWRVPASWLDANGLSANDTIIVRAEGDTMAGTINHGQLVIVDLRPRTIDGIYIVRFGSTVRIKRVQQMVDGGLRLLNDNPAYADDVVAVASHVQLQMVGFCHGMVAPLW